MKTLAILVVGVVVGLALEALLGKPWAVTVLVVVIVAASWGAWRGDGHT